jgi:hypothetical protein
MVCFTEGVKKNKKQEATKADKKPNAKDGKGDLKENKQKQDVQKKKNVKNQNQKKADQKAPDVKPGDKKGAAKDKPKEVKFEKKTAETRSKEG